MPACAVRVQVASHVRTKAAAEKVGRGSERTVVVAVDETEAAMDALSYAFKSYGGPGDRLVLVHVALPADPYCENVQQDAAEIRRSEKVLQRFLEKATIAKISAEAHVLVGEPRTELEEFVLLVKPDAVVVGRGRLNLFARMLLGSVSDHLAHHCPCPVLIVNSGTAKLQSEADSHV